MGEKDKEEDKGEYGMIKDLLVICTIVVCIVDVSGFVFEIKERIRKWLGIRSEISIKPFDCSMCMTFWSGLVYLVVCSEINLYNLCLLLLIAVNSEAVHQTVRLGQSLLLKIINMLDTLLC